MRTIHSIMQALHKQTGKHHSRRPAHSIQMLFGRILQNMRNLTIGASGGRFVMAGKKADRVFIPAGKISGKNGQKSTLLAANGRIKFQPPSGTAFNQKDNKVVAEKKQELPPLKKKAKSVAAGLSGQPWFTGKVAKLLTQAIRNGKGEETFFSASDGRLAVKVRFKQGKLMAEIQTADPKLAKETRQILSAQIAKIKSTQGGGSEKIKVSVVRIKETTEQTATGGDRIGRGKSVARNGRPNPDGVGHHEFKAEAGKEIPVAKTAGQASSLSKTSAHRKTAFKRIINEQPEQEKESPATGQKTQAKPETFNQIRVARHGNRSQVHSAGQAPAKKAADAKNKKVSSGKRGSAQNLREAESKTNGTNRIPARQTEPVKTQKETLPFIERLMEKGTWTVRKRETKTAKRSGTNRPQTEERHRKQEVRSAAAEKSVRTNKSEAAAGKQADLSKTAAAKNKPVQNAEFAPTAKANGGIQQSVAQAKPVLPSFAARIEALLVKYSQARAMGNKSSVFKLQESPFGQMEIRFEEHKQGKRVTILVESEQMKSALQKHIPQIQQNMVAKGMDALSLNIGLGSFSGQPEQAKNERHQHKNHPSKNAKPKEEYHDHESSPVNVRKFGYNTMEILA